MAQGANIPATSAEIQVIPSGVIQDTFTINRATGRVNFLFNFSINPLGLSMITDTSCISNVQIFL
jgi:hypothetical protein